MSRLCIIPAQALEDRRLRSGDILVLNVIGNYVNKSNGWHCWLYHTTIAKTLNMHVDSVRKSTYRLAACGYLKILPRKSRTGGQVANVYQMLFDTNAPEPPEFEKLISESVSPGPVDPPPCDSISPPPGSGDHRAINIDTLTSSLTNKEDISPKAQKRISY